MNQIALITGAIFGILAIILGAFGAHAFKKVLSDERLSSFEVAVQYQMYAALYLLIIGFNFDFVESYQDWIVKAMLWGTILFSGSIYLLSFQDVWKVKLKFLGPITPLGGFFMIISWVVLLVSYI